MFQKRTVAIVVPIHKEELTPEEKVSLRHLIHFLGRYDKYFVIPDNLNINIPNKDFMIKKFNRKYFQSTKTYSKLMLSTEFYDSFRAYEYILIYQLDSLVFSDQLIQWCKKGYDYIGSPWFRTEIKKAAGWDSIQDCVGNGGFSLRKVQSFLKVLHIYQNPHQQNIPHTQRKKVTLIIQHALKINIDHHYQGNEDFFWSLEAKKLYPDFKIPSPEIAVSFAFEVGPRFCFKKNNNSLPFGCHAWLKYDKEFWQPFLLK